ncbi:MAG: hypothetical protein IMZ57_01330 [Acidobacteria bacterium]|nr:hypothetical protein [Acidobacteriota bacterium]
MSDVEKKRQRNRIMKRICALALGSAIGTGGAAAATLKPFGLRCEYAINPLGVDRPRPIFSRKLESEIRGERQTAYRVLVASARPLLDRSAGDL